MDVVSRFGAGHIRSEGIRSFPRVQKNVIEGMLLDKTWLFSNERFYTRVMSKNTILDIKQVLTTAHCEVVTSSLLV